MNAERECPVIVLFYIYCVIEVLCVRSVYSYDKLIANIFPAGINTRS